MAILTGMRIRAFKQINIHILVLQLYFCFFSCNTSSNYENLLEETKICISYNNNNVNDFISDHSYQEIKLVFGKKATAKLNLDGDDIIESKIYLISKRDLHSSDSLLVPSSFTEDSESYSISFENPCSELSLMQYYQKSPCVYCDLHETQLLINTSGTYFPINLCDRRKYVYYLNGYKVSLENDKKIIDLAYYFSRPF